MARTLQAQSLSQTIKPWTNLSLSQTLEPQILSELKLLGHLSRRLLPTVLLGPEIGLMIPARLSFGGR